MNRKEVFKDRPLETSKCMRDGASVFSCDSERQMIAIIKIMYPDSLIKTHVNDHSGILHVEA